MRTNVRLAKNRKNLHMSRFYTNGNLCRLFLIFMLLTGASLAEKPNQKAPEPVPLTPTQKTFREYILASEEFNKDRMNTYLPNT